MPKMATVCMIVIVCRSSMPVESAGAGVVSSRQRGAWENTGIMDTTPETPTASVPPGACKIDAGRRFGGVASLYGSEAPGLLAGAHVAVAGLGGVGSWTVEALARCGIGALTLIDLDVIAESNVNRQIHALTPTLGQAKVEAMADRVLGINPACAMTRVDDFVEPDNVARVLAGDYAVIVDCTDQAAAKIAMILHARARGIPLLSCGGAGGKTDPLALRAGDLSEATHDALLAKLRNTLRREHGFPRASDRHGKALKRVPKMGVRALWFDQQAILPAARAQAGSRNAAPQGLSCAGYGSVVTVTAAMGLVAADEAVKLIV
jgi:tRNA A37 threonylcarbamoyladenosine dehydratase